MDGNKRKSERGFTLIEVLVVSSIIGVLSAISVQIFIVMRTRTYDSRASSDLRNAAAAEAAYFAETETFLNCATAEECASVLPGIPVLSPGVTLAITATTSGFIGTSSHPKGTGIVYRWNNNEGGMVN